MIIKYKSEQTHEGLISLRKTKASLRITFLLGTCHQTRIRSSKSLVKCNLIQAAKQENLNLINSILKRI